MQILINKFFEFSLNRLKNPLVIVGLIIAILGFVLLLFVDKLIFKLLEKKEIKKYLDIEKQEDIDNRVDNTKYKSKLIARIIGLIFIVLGFILCMAGV